MAQLFFIFHKLFEDIILLCGSWHQIILPNVPPSLHSWAVDSCIFVFEISSLFGGFAVSNMVTRGQCCIKLMIRAVFKRMLNC